MGDRRTEVNHPASGITSFTYDALGNVLTKQTANLAKEGKFIHGVIYAAARPVPSHLSNDMWMHRDRSHHVYTLANLSKSSHLPPNPYSDGCLSQL